MLQNNKHIDPHSHVTLILYPSSFSSAGKYRLRALQAARAPSSSAEGVKRSVATVTSEAGDSSSSRKRRPSPEGSTRPPIENSKEGAGFDPTYVLGVYKSCCRFVILALQLIHFPPLVDKTTKGLRIIETVPNFNSDSRKF